MRNNESFTWGMAQFLYTRPRRLCPASGSDIFSIRES